LPRRSTRLVYFERFEDIHNAIEREKQIKGWLRIKKIALIVSVNPAWRDLSLKWFSGTRFSRIHLSRLTGRRPCDPERVLCAKSLP
jgi:hypothetical protein